MIELTGKYGTAQIFIDELDNGTVAQIINMLNQEGFKDTVVRIMPDTHAGKNCVIGATIKVANSIIPNIVGSDIGCGMTAVKLKEKKIDFTNLDSVIRKYIPFGGDIHKQSNESHCSINLHDLRMFGKDRAVLREDIAYKSVGTLGGGNHFIEIDKDTDGSLWLVVHSGSRHLGTDVCNYYQNLAYEGIVAEANKELYAERDTEIAKLKALGKSKNIGKVIDQYKKLAKKPSVPFEFAYLTGENMNDYLHDMQLTQEFASCNRSEMIRVILKNAKLHEVDRFETVHNYVEHRDTGEYIIRKGAIRAEDGEKVLIPINMAEGSLICIGKGNKDYNYSAPHGAGRLMARREAKESLSINEYKERMKGIFTTCISKATLDESPMAYKSMDTILENIKDTVDVIEVIKPVYNFKASE